jgi:hypothetical protein
LGGKFRKWRKAEIQPKKLLKFRLGGAMHAVGARICIHSRKKQRGKLAPCGDGRRIDRPPSVEKLQQLLARAIVVPAPVAFDDFD